MNGTMLSFISFSSIKIFSVIFYGKFLIQRIHAKNPEHYCNNIEGNDTQQMIIACHKVWIKM